jgi:glycogen(starch) synthase
MKLAVFSNLWPPLFIGGYEIGASHVARELRRRGHEVLVISAHEYHLIRPDYYETRRHEEADRAQIVDAGLCLFGDMIPFMSKHRRVCFQGMLRSIQCRRRYRAALRAFQPDALLIFNPLGVLASVVDDFVAYSRQTGVPVHAYVSDHWLAGWPGGHPMPGVFHYYLHNTTRMMRLRGRILRKLMYHFGLAPDHLPLIDHYFYCSQFIKELSQSNSVGVAGHTVVHWGIPNMHRTATAAPDHFSRSAPLTLVYAGQIIDHKGLPVILRALARCQARHELMVIGDDQVTYASKCKEIAAHLGVLPQVRFLGLKKHAEMLQLIRDGGHLLIVPSLWEEPFSIVVLEGMGVGLPVIASNTGGTPEAIVVGENGFLFERGDHRQLAELIDRLEGDRPLCQRIGSQARNWVLQRFTMEKMVDQLLAHLPIPAQQANRGSRAA